MEKITHAETDMLLSNRINGWKVSTAAVFRLVRWWLPFFSALLADFFIFNNYYQLFP
jgi:hypothetical protein